MECGYLLVMSGVGCFEGREDCAIVGDLELSY